MFEVEIKQTWCRVASRIEAYRSQLQNLLSASWPREALVAAVLVAAASGVSAAGGKSSSDFIPEMRAHDKPHPFHLMPVYDLLHAGGEMPYVQTMSEPILGSIEGVDGAVHSVRFGTSYNTATNGYETFVNARLKSDSFFIQGVASTESTDDYDDASGNEQRFGYERETTQFIAGLTPDKNRTLKAIYVHDFIGDHKMPLGIIKTYNAGALAVLTGYGADPIKTEREVVKLTWDEKFNHSVFKKIRAELFSIELDRKANNFDLRPTTAVTNRAEAIVDRTKRSVSFGTDLTVGASDLNLDLKYTRIRHIARRYGGPGGAITMDDISGYNYPGVELDELLLSTTSKWEIDNSNKLILGISWKRVDADATHANVAVVNAGIGNPASLELYQNYYGTGVNVEQSDSHWSGKLQWEYQPQDRNLNGYLSIGHIYRSPDTQERYFALQAFTPDVTSPMGPSVSAVGNPEINWELHRRVEAGLTYKSDHWSSYGSLQGDNSAWRFQAKAYYDNVADFISRDRAHGQTATGINDSTRIWRNVDAEISGIELDLQANITQGWSTRLNLHATRGRNVSDDRDLYGMTPLETSLYLDYFGRMGNGGSWNFGGRLRYVAEHDDVDADPTSGSGFDAGETDAFATLDVYAGVQLHDRVGIRCGVNNVTNKEYSEPNASYPLDGIPYLVEAPERSYFISLVANF